jgi:hypothetical protein
MNHTGQEVSTRFLIACDDIADLSLTKIQEDLRKSACRCSDAGRRQCTSQFTVGSVLDLRLIRKETGYVAEKLLRQQELTCALQQRDATNSGRLQFLVQGKVVCLQGYMTLCCVPKASGFALISKNQSDFVL